MERVFTLVCCCCGIEVPQPDPCSGDSILVRIPWICNECEKQKQASQEQKDC